MKSTQNQKNEGTHLGHCKCPNCAKVGKDRKGNNLSLFRQKDGSIDGWCWGCETYFNSKDVEDMTFDLNDKPLSASTQPIHSEERLTLASVNSLPNKAITKRCLKASTIQKYGVKVTEEKIFYPRYQENILKGYKCRKLPKIFDPREGATPVGDIGSKEFWGQNLFEKGNGLVIITEGEEDAMSVFQATEENSPKHTGYAAVSVPNGVGSLRKTVLENYDWLIKFDKIIFAMDQQPEVLEKVREVSRLLPPRKAFIAKFSEKDASDMLQKGKVYELYKAIWNAEEYKPEGLILSSETWDVWQNRNNFEAVPIPEEWGLNSTLKGIRLGGLYTVGAGTGVGKTTMLKILQLHLWRSTNHNIGVIALEEPLCDSIGMLMGLYLNKRIHVDNVDIDPEKQKEVWLKLFGDNRFVFEQGFGALTEENLYDKIRYMVRVQGCKYIFIDHLTILTDMFGDGKGTKLEQSAKLVAAIKNLTQELDCAIIQVSHVRKRDESSRSYEEGAVPSLDSLYGAAAIKQYSDAVLVIARDQRENPSVTTYHVIKNRLSGHLGHGNPLTYNFETGWLEKIKEVL
jgi:twinkle protein